MAILGNGGGQQGGGTWTAPSASIRSKSTGQPSAFKPQEVRVQGFYDYGSGQGALQAAEVEELAAKLLDGLPDELTKKFVVKAQYAQSRRITFACEGGGECCWQLREKLMENIKSKDIKQNGKDLYCRVQEAPDKEMKKGHYWRAVAALKVFAKEDVDVILVPKTFGIHSAEKVDLLGSATEEGYVLDEDALKSAMPSLNVVGLKKAMLQRRRRK